MPKLVETSQSNPYDDYGHVNIDISNPGSENNRAKNASFATLSFDDASIVYTTHALQFVCASVVVPFSMNLRRGCCIVCVACFSLTSTDSQVDRPAATVPIWSTPNREHFPLVTTLITAPWYEPLKHLEGAAVGNLSGSSTSPRRSIRGDASAVVGGSESGAQPGERERERGRKGERQRESESESDGA